MGFCTRCGKQIENGQICECSAQNPKAIDTSSLKGLYVSLKNRMGIGEPENNATDCYERGMKIVPDNIKTNDGEVPVKQYDIAVLRSRLKFERAEGRLQVTNKRIIFRATGRSIMGRTTIQHEFAIDELAGIEARRDYKFSFLNILIGYCILMISFFIMAAISSLLYSESAPIGVIFGFIGGIGGIIPFFMWYKKFPLKLLFLGASIGCFSTIFMLTGNNKLIGLFTLISFVIAILGFFLYAFIPNLILTIKVKGASPAVDIRRKRNPGLLGLFMGNSTVEEFTGYDEVLPTNETEKAIREIGAMISDIQKLGDFGIEKWLK